MADAEPLFALLEIMLRTFNVNVPKVKPGGHPDDIFLRLTDEDREELECSICYQVLKEVRQCANNHRFCYSCIFVWSTSGSPVNHGRCPVCRTDGNYVRNAELDDRINQKIVKCSTKGCKWIGSLKHLASHKHTNYNSDQTAEGQSDELPALAQSSSTPSASRPRSRASVASSQPTLTATPAPAQNTAENSAQPRRPLTNVTNNTSAVSAQSRSSTNTAQSRTSSQRTANSQATNRTRNRSRARNNSTSPQRRVTTSTTGLNTRLTSRARIHNGQTLSTSSTPSRSQAPTPATAVSTAVAGSGAGTRSVGVTAAAGTGTAPRDGVNRNESQAGDTVTHTTESALTPRPPTTPRPQGQSTTRRRFPTLPSIVNPNTTQGDNTTTAPSSTTTTPTAQNPVTTDRNNNNNNINENDTSSVTENPLSFASSRRNPLEGTSIARRGGNGTPRGFATVRDRLNESRARLDMLMNAFSVELDRGRHDLTSFQQERERRRQEQLTEVRDLGVRLGQVATELRGLLSQRRQIRTQIDHLVDSGSGPEDDAD